MAIKIPVVDRVPTYPGRVTLTPVTGQENVYDMVRSDAPAVEGTPINRELFDNKAYTLTKNVTVYVATNGDDTEGTGSATAPFKTIQKAVDALPKHLGGYTATITMASGTYPERVEVKDFCAGRLLIGAYGDIFTINGIDIINSSFVETNIYIITRASGSSRPLYSVKDGSNVFIGSDMVLDGGDASISGMIVERNSHVVVASNTKLTCDNCAMMVVASWCSFVSLDNIVGGGNIFGLSATQGGVISYKTDTSEKMWSNNADTGGLVLTGKNSSDLSGATLDL